MKKTKAVFFDLASLMESGKMILQDVDELKKITNNEMQEEEFFKQIRMIKDVRETMKDLRSRNILSVLCISASTGVAECFTRRLGFDDFLCSGNTGSSDDPGSFNRIIREGMEEFLKAKELKKEDCLAVLASEKGGFPEEMFDRTMVLVFSREVYGKAGRYLYTDKLAEVLKFV